MYFGLLSVLTQVGVAESEKRVAAIFLLPVSPLEPRKRSFRPYSGSYGCLVARRRPKNVAQPSTPTTLSVNWYFGIINHSCCIILINKNTASKRDYENASKGRPKSSIRKMFNVQLRLIFCFTDNNVVKYFWLGRCLHV